MLAGERAEIEQARFGGIELAGIKGERTRRRSQPVLRFRRLDERAVE